MISFLYLRLIVLALLLNSYCCIDVSWIPSDPEGPLPLSRNYRDALRKLCDMIDTNAPLPLQISEKKDVIQSLCFRLGQENNDPLTSIASKRNLMLGIAVVVGGLAIAKYGGVMFQWFKSPVSGHKVGSQTATPQDIREIRMKKFMESKQS